MTAPNATLPLPPPRGHLPPEAMRWASSCPWRPGGGWAAYQRIEKLLGIAFIAPAPMAAPNFFASRSATFSFGV